jgi:hypothetical protein
MMAARNRYTISRPVSYVPDAEFDHAVRFAVDKRDAALMPVLRASTPGVVTVTDEPDQMDDALRAAGADLLGQQYGYARAGFVRHALRPSSQGAGRDRWR